MKFENVKVLGYESPILNKREYDMFCWGRVIAVHKIGEYEIIEFLDMKRAGCRITKEVSDVKQFHINGAGCSTNTLDQALIYAIANKAGRYRDADFICKGLGI